VRTSVGATLVAVFCAGLSLAAEFQNGSFEEGPVLPVCNIFNIPAGDSTTITGWTVIEEIRLGGPTAAAGSGQKVPAASTSSDSRRRRCRADLRHDSRRDL
jgi:hypothetical protein